jgi:hypothetical protein
MAAIALCLAAALCAAAPAMASRGVTRTAGTALPANSQRSVTAVCPAGTHSTAGGFFVSPAGAPGQGPQSWTQVSMPSGTGGWKVTGGSSGVNPPATLTSSVRCEKRRDGRIAVRLQGSSTITPGTAQNYDFHCPSGTHPIGAGWSVNNPYNGNIATSSNLVVIQSRRTGPSHWLVTAEVRSGAAVSSTFVPKVPCEFNSRRKLVEKSKIVPYLDQQRVTATATCAKRTHVVSGGFVISPLPSTDPTPVPFGIMDYNAAPTGRTWRIDLYDTTFAAPTGSSLSTYAYCRRNRLRRPQVRRISASSGALGPGRVEISPAQAVFSLAG